MEAGKQPSEEIQHSTDLIRSRTLDDFCRICLLQKPSLLPLTSEFNGTMIPEMLWKVSGTLLNVLEHLPLMICEHCLTKLDLAYNIAQEFRKQEELLRSFCWKGALVDQLDGFQKTEDANRVPYSDEVLKKLIPAKDPSVTPNSEKEKETQSEIDRASSPEKSMAVEGIELCVEHLDDIIEVESDDIEEDGQPDAEDHFEMIVEENRFDTEFTPKEKQDVRSDCCPDEESQNSGMITKKELNAEEYEKDSADDMSVLVIKVEDEEWIEEERLPEKIEDGGSDSEHLAMASCGETGDSQDPIWFDDQLNDDDDGADDDADVYEHEFKQVVQAKHKKTENEPIDKQKRIIKSKVNADGLFECKICSRTFSVQKTFLNHVRNHEHVLQGSFKCRQCEKVFGTKNRLMRHEEIHTRDLSCKECNKKFANYHELRAHQLVHMRGKRKCSHCDFVCYTREQMKQHRQTSACAKMVNPKPPPKPAILKDKTCPYEGCNYQAVTYGAMYVHKRSKHQAMFECDMCEKKFAFANQLKQHETIHTGEKPFRCDICEKSFRRLFSFKEHMAIHEGEQKFECDICGKTFSRPRYLSAHIATHTTNRPFECTMCGSNYKTKSELTKHIRAKHEALEYGNGNDLIEEDYDYFEDEIYL